MLYTKLDRNIGDEQFDFWRGEETIDAIGLRDGCNEHMRKIHGKAKTGTRDIFL